MRTKFLLSAMNPVIVFAVVWPTVASICSAISYGLVSFTRAPMNENEHFFYSLVLGAFGGVNLTALFMVALLLSKHYKDLQSVREELSRAKLDRGGHYEVIRKTTEIIDKQLESFEH